MDHRNCRGKDRAAETLDGTDGLLSPVADGFAESLGGAVVGMSRTNATRVAGTYNGKTHTSGV
jgi:hypothetical protein